MDKYENHREEWREEDAKRRAGYVEEERICTTCGKSLEGVHEEFTTCHECFFTEASGE